MPMPVLLAATALLAFSPAPMCPRPTAVATRAPAAVAVAEAVDPQVIGGIALVVAAGGGFAYSQKDKSSSPKAPSAPKPKAAPKAKTISPAAMKAAQLKSWGLKTKKRGVSSHRMQGTMPKPKPREIWVAPPGWKAPSPPVQSWYDRGERLPAPAPPPAPPAPAKKKSWMDSLMSTFSSSVEAPSSTSSTSGTMTAAQKAAQKKSWGLSTRRGVTPHRMTGTMPKPKPRKMWVPPPGWQPPSPPPKPPSVDSWYDSGARLA